MEVVVKNLTYQEFREMEFPDNDRNFYEIIEGKLVGRKAPNLLHQRVAGSLLMAIGEFCLKTKCGEVLHAPLDVVLDERNVFQPDLLFVKKERRDFLFENDDFVSGAPDLVVEILASDTVFFDKGAKKDGYEKFGVREYWIVNPKSNTIEVYAYSEQRYRLVAFLGEEEVLRSLVLEGFELEVSAVFKEAND